VPRRGDGPCDAAGEQGDDHDREGVRPVQHSQLRHPVAEHPEQHLDGDEHGLEPGEREPAGHPREERHDEQQQGQRRDDRHPADAVHDDPAEAGEVQRLALQRGLVEHAAVGHPLDEPGRAVGHRRGLHDDAERDQVRQDPVRLPQLRLPGAAVSPRRARARCDLPPTRAVGRPGIRMIGDR
jgi:hypothetical protein